MLPPLHTIGLFLALWAGGEGGSGPARQGAAQEATNAYRGRVVDERGAPVAGAEVVLGVDCFGTGLWFGPPPRRILELERTTSTGMDGCFEFVGLDARECYSLRVRHSEFAVLDTQTSAVGHFGDFEASETFRLGPGTRITGFVRDEEGEPISGARVQLDGLKYRGEPEPHPDLVATNTAPDGSFVFEHAGHGQRFLTVSAPGFATREVNAFGMADRSRNDVHVVLPVQALLRGIVRERNGSPIAGAQVLASPKAPSRPAHARATSDERGEFTIEALETGTWRVFALARGWRFEQAFDANTDGGAIWIEGLRRPRVRGRVVCDRTGEPVAAFSLALRTVDPYSGTLTRFPELVERVVHGIAGRFELLSVAATDDHCAVLEVRNPGGAPSFSACFAVGASDDVEGIEVRMRDGGAIHGRVIDTDGRPVCGAFVRACTAEPNFEQPLEGFERDALYRRRATRTDERGEFLIEHLGPEPHTLLVDAADRVPRELARVLVSDNRTNAIGDVVLTRGALVRGRVVDRTCCDVPRILLEPLDSSGRAPLETRSNARGGFELRAVPPGMYRLSARCGGALRRPGQDGPAGRILELGEGQALLDVVLEVDP